MPRRLMISKSNLQPVSNGLICWLDGRDGINNNTTWNDRSGNNKNAIFVNADWSSVKFLNNQLVFDGVNKSPYVSLGVLYNNVTEVNVTYDLIKTAENTYNIIGLLEQIPNNNRIAINSTDIGIMFIANGITGKSILTTINLNTKYNISINYKSTAIECFINGVLVGTITGITIPFDKFNGQSMRLNNSSFSQLICKISSFKTYNRALTQSEVQQNYIYEQSIARG